MQNFSDFCTSYNLHIITFLCFCMLLHIISACLSLCVSLHVLNICAYLCISLQVFCISLISECPCKCDIFILFPVGCTVAPVADWVLELPADSGSELPVRCTNKHVNNGSSVVLCSNGNLISDPLPNCVKIGLLFQTPRFTWFEL